MTAPIIALGSRLKQCQSLKLPYALIKFPLSYVEHWLEHLLEHLQLKSREEREQSPEQDDNKHAWIRKRS
jgi:hypothetical protein